MRTVLVFCFISLTISLFSQNISTQIAELNELSLPMKLDSATLYDLKKMEPSHLSLYDSIGGVGYGKLCSCSYYDIGKTEFDNYWFIIFGYHIDCDTFPTFLSYKMIILDKNSNETFISSELATIILYKNGSYELVECEVDADLRISSRRVEKHYGEQAKSSYFYTDIKEEVREINLRINSGKN